MGWTKLYSSGERISEPQSWSRTSLDSMIGTELIYNNLMIGIYGPGQYWQSDQYEVDIKYGTNYPTMVKRRLLKYIDTVSAGVIENRLPDSYKVHFGDIKVNEENKDFIFVSKVPLWYVLELNLKTNKLTYYYSDCKI
jgi:hypothetical protein